MTAIIEISGGCGEVTAGRGVIVDWDNIEDDDYAAQAAPNALRGLRSKAARRIRKLYPGLGR